jgi:hypothetical protein
LRDIEKDGFGCICDKADRDSICSTTTGGGARLIANSDSKRCACKRCVDRYNNDVGESLDDLQCYGVRSVAVKPALQTKLTVDAIGKPVVVRQAVIIAF